MPRILLNLWAGALLLVILGACTEDPLGPASRDSGQLTLATEDGDSMSWSLLDTTNTTPDYVNASEIEIYKNFDAFNAREESVLMELGFVKGVDFGVKPTQDLQSGIPSDTRVIILPSNFGGIVPINNVNHPSAQANLTAFVEGGGVLVISLADNVNATSYIAPGLVAVTSNAPVTNSYDLADDTNAIALGPDGLSGTWDDWTQANIQWTSSCCVVRGYLPPLPANSKVVLTSSGNPVFAEYRLGLGRVLVRSLGFEAGTQDDPGAGTQVGSPRRMLRNELYYATHVDTRRPVVMDVLGSPNPVPVNDAVTLTARADDSEAGDSDITSAEYSIDGGAFVAMASQDGSFDSSVETLKASIPSFPGTGVHQVCVRASDAAENTSLAECILLAVYDPSAGFVTGAGWIDSPLGAYVADLTLVGIARFAFIAKYQKGATAPQGSTQFVFRAGDLDFRSQSYDWLVVAGARAQFKGVGAINGRGNYGFLLTAIDGQKNGGGGTDKFRIKIWDRVNGDTLVYDNKFGASDTGGDATVLGGGTITIHAK